MSKEHSSQQFEYFYITYFFILKYCKVSIVYTHSIVKYHFNYKSVFAWYICSFKIHSICNFTTVKCNSSRSKEINFVEDHLA